MKMQHTDRDGFSESVDALVIFAPAEIQPKAGKHPGQKEKTPALPPEVRDMLDGWNKRMDASFKPRSVTAFPAWRKAPPHVLLVAGLGDLPGISDYEQAAAAAAYWARNHGCRSLGFRMFGADPEMARAVARGVHEGSYRMTRYHSDAKPGSAVSSVVFMAAAEQKKSILKAAEMGCIEGETFDEIRDLANLPGNDAPPAVLAATARTLAKKYGLRCTILRQAELKKRGFNALLAVAQGSVQEPALIVLEHRGNGHGRPLALVGKAVTFDSGGISLKAGKGMENMKYDKCGAMAVLAAIVAAARLKLPQPAVAVIAAVENMPDGNAQRPGDIVRSLSGQTIEVQNTDAEGRLILADALTWSGRYKPAAIVDLATLTGAVVIALGHHAAAVLGTDDALCGDLTAAGKDQGEALWPLPLWKEYEEAIRCAHADMRNTGDGTAGTIAGGIFLKKFVPENIPWAHLDIAGMAWQENKCSRRDRGATLYGARLLIRWMERGLSTGKHKGAKP